MSTFNEYYELLKTCDHWRDQQREKLRHDFIEKITSILQDAIEDDALSNLEEIDPEKVSDFALRFLGTYSIKVSEKNVKLLEALLDKCLDFPYDVETTKAEAGHVNLDFSFTLPPRKY